MPIEAEVVAEAEVVMANTEEAEVAAEAEEVTVKEEVAAEAEEVTVKEEVAEVVPEVSVVVELMASEEEDQRLVKPDLMLMEIQSNQPTEEKETSIMLVTMVKRNTVDTTEETEPVKPEEEEERMVPVNLVKAKNQNKDTRRRTPKLLKPLKEPLLRNKRKNQRSRRSQNTLRKLLEYQWMTTSRIK